MAHIRQSGQTADVGKEEQPLRALVRKLNEGLTMHETFPVCPPPALLRQSVTEYGTYKTVKVGFWHM